MQVRIGSAREYDGVGLGLTVANRMAQRWGQTIHGYSEGLDHGSRFWFIAPLAARANANVRRMSLLSNPTNLLLLDDDDCSAKCITQTCTSLGINVERTSASNVTYERFR